MEAIVIKATDDTPAIHFEPVADTFWITSHSLSEDANTFYTTIAEWLQN